MDGKCYKITETVLNFYSLILNKEGCTGPSNSVTCQDALQGNKT